MLDSRIDCQMRQVLRIEVSDDSDSKHKLAPSGIIPLQHQRHSGLNGQAYFLLIRFVACLAALFDFGGSELPYSSDRFIQ